MSAAPDPRGPHPCLDRGCGHPETDHWRTPELAGPLELVVWCVSCRRHEVRRRRWRLSAVDRPKKRAIFGRPN
jgi:hypothetical protein